MREPSIVFPLDSGAKALDVIAFGERDRRERLASQPLDTWRPLRLQLHYFEFLNDPGRSQLMKSASVTEWIEHNPRARGDGWTPYPVSLRMVNWIKFFGRIGSGGVDERWLRALYEHALWLENNLELHIRANHYLKNAKALLFAGLFFSGADAERWEKRGRDIFFAQMHEQFLDDGGHYERSPMYHALGVEDLLDVYRYLSAGIRPISAELLETLRAYALRALDFYTAILMPDGTPPLFNDAVRDVAPSSAELYAYAKATLGYEASHESNGLTLRVLASSGYYVVRDGDSMLVIDCGPLGPAYQPGHGHCDALSYELALRGERVVVDTGVFDYEPGETRRYVRSTAAHNTVQIDDAEQSEMWDVFRVARRARPIEPSLALTGVGTAAFSGAHDGFKRSPAKAVHRRNVDYDNARWIVKDSIAGIGRHRIESRIHLRPGLEARVRHDGALIVGANEKPVAELIANSGGTVRVEDARYFPRFGVVEAGHVIVLTSYGMLPMTLTYSIASVGTESDD